MNSVAEILAAILGTLVLTLGGVGLGWAIRRKGAEKERQIKVLIELSASASMLAGSLDRYLKAIEGAEAPLKDIPKIMAGWVKLSGEGVTQINALRGEVKTLRESIFRKDEVRAVENPTEEQAGLAWEIQRQMQMNPQLSYMDATARALEEMSKSVVGANQFSLE